MTPAARPLGPLGELGRREAVLGLLGTLVVGGAVASLSGCASGPELVPSDDDATDIGAEVLAIDNRYEPAEVTVRRGQAVTWTFAGSMKHDVVANDRSFVSELLREGSYTHVFGEAGEFPYLCSIHPEMVGVVRVV